MLPHEILETIESILKVKGISKAEFCEACGITRAAMSYWKEDRNFPQMKTLEAINEYLGTTFCISLGHENTAIPEDSGISEKDAKLLAWFRALPEETQKGLLYDADAPKGLV